MNKIYFAHPINTYNTKQETDWLILINKLLPETEIINPNNSIHEEAYKYMGMVYFEELAKSCDIGVFLPFSDGNYGMGVFSEMLAMVSQSKTTLTLTSDGRLVSLDFKKIQPLSINQTRARLKLQN